jgi:hypothetical protein
MKWITLNDSPSLAVLKYYGAPRSEWAWQWLCLNFPDGIPESIDGEILYEVCPEDIRAEVELYFAKTNSVQ